MNDIPNWLQQIFLYVGGFTTSIGVVLFAMSLVGFVIKGLELLKERFK